MDKPKHVLVHEFPTDFSKEDWEASRLLTPIRDIMLLANPDHQITFEELYEGYMMLMRYGYFYGGCG